MATIPQSYQERFAPHRRSRPRHTGTVHKITYRKAGREGWHILQQAYGDAAEADRQARNFAMANPTLTGVRVEEARS